MNAEEIILIPINSLRFLYRLSFFLGVLILAHIAGHAIIRAVGLDLPRPKYFEERVWRWLGTYSPSIDPAQVRSYRIAWGAVYLTMIAILFVAFRYLL